MSWAYLRQFPSLVWIVILGTFMVRTTFFMVWPFLSILLYRDYGLSATLIGAILGATAALSTLVSFYGGWLSDKWGRRNILLFGCLVSAASVALLGLSPKVGWLALGVIGSGLSYGLIDAPGKALMADNLAEPKARELALHLRYFLLNLGAAIGPLLGVTYGLSARQETFLLLSASYLLLGMVFVIGFRLAGCHTSQAAGPGMRAVLRVLWQDRGFLLLIMANLLLMLVYAQFESPLIQYLTRAGTPEVERLIGWLVTTNALTIVMLQFPPAAPDCPLVHAAQAATRGGALSRRPVAVCAGGYRHLVALDSGGDPLERRGVHPLPLAQCADRSDGAWSFEGELFRGGLHLRTRGGHGGLAGRLGAGPLGRELALRPDGAALPGDPDALWSEYPDLAPSTGPGRALTARRSAPCRRPESIGPARGGCLSLCPRQGVAG